ncbi:ABC transporter substrate-binding protein [Piscinibacter terrae]|uniref:ABC transporter substrate-binding protein n=1 Tax=Piscinibacter terrae TaxID=2496871 RepID=A0A3N7HPN4_9BURK|nr:ABC transporter substrate-binding protein [Albitalea terrae]RQP24130.1 ABC transporter substrate-binding protein [Albitalea terrae]
MSQPLNRRHVLKSLAAATATLGATRSLLAAESKEDILIGQSTHLSGPLASTMTSVVSGQELAIDEINRKGGINGRKLKIITLDDAYDPKRCVENVTTLIDKHKVVALTGLASTGNVVAVLPLLAEKQVPLIGVYTGAPALRAKQHPYFFTFTASYRDEVVKMVRNLATVGRTQLALAYHDSPFGKLMLPVVEEVVKEQGSTLVAKQALDIPGQNAVQVCQALAAAKPQGVIFMAFGPALVPFVKAARAQIGVPVYAPSVANSKQLLEALGDEARGLAITQTVPYPYQRTSALTRDYGAAMDRAKLTVDFDHFFGYLDIRSVIECLKRSAKDLSAQGIVRAIEGMGKVDMGGFTVNFSSANHHGSSFVDLMIVGPNGRYIR